MDEPELEVLLLDRNVSIFYNDFYQDLSRMNGREVHKIKQLGTYMAWRVHTHKKLVSLGKVSGEESFRELKERDFKEYQTVLEVVLEGINDLEMKV